MSFKEIKELRLAGKLDESLQMANLALAIEPDNIWNKRAAAWVYYDFIKKNSQLESFDSFKENLIKIKDLHLPEDEKMVFDNCAWQIGSMVFAIQKAEPVDYVKINELFRIIKDFHFTKPSEAFSFIYKAFHKGYQNWSGYLTFADWWNFDNLRSEDYLKEEFNGKKMMSIAEQAYIAYSKKLAEGEPLNQLSQQKAFDKAKIESFLPKIDALIENHPDYQYPPYFKAKLLLALGNDKNVLSAFLPFAKQKRNDFWVWELMAEIFSEHKDIQFACYCKALSLRTSEDFLVKLRQTFAEMLIEKRMHNEAKTEIQRTIATRKKHEWKLPNQIVQWTELEWYKSATSKKDNIDLYLNHIKQAEEILFQDIPEEIIVVEFVNENKNMLNFVKDKQKFGFFNYSGNLIKPQIGDLLKVRFNGHGQDGFYKVLTAKKANSNTKSDAIKEFEGTVSVISPLNYGLVENVFIDSKIIEEKKITDGQILNGNALIAFNKKKNEWGWKAIKLKNQ
jgi:hypothetical protein